MNTKEYTEKVEEREALARRLHGWYLEAVGELNAGDFNPNAVKFYDELTEGQKHIDKFIASKIGRLLAEQKTSLLRGTTDLIYSLQRPLELFVGEPIKTVRDGVDVGWNSAIAKILSILEEEKTV